MSDANALFETAIRIAAVADCDDECRTAAGLMQQAAELGHGAAAGAYGNMLMNGFGGKFDPDQAFHYWSQAALEGADADSAFRLGMVCRDGRVLEQDLASALAWFLVARDLGSVIVLPDIDDVQFELDEAACTEAYRRYDELRASSERLR